MTNEDRTDYPEAFIVTIEGVTYMPTGGEAVVMPTATYLLTPKEPPQRKGN